MKQQHINEIKALIVLAVGLIVLASLLSFDPEDLAWFTSNPNVPAHNWVRICGAYVGGALLFVFGHSAYAVVIFLIFWSWNKLASRDLSFSFSKILSFVVMFLVSSALFSMVGSQGNTARFERSGIVGFVVSDLLVQYLGRFGSYVVLVLLGVSSAIIIGEFLISPLLMKIPELLRELKDSLGKKLREERNKVFTVKPKSKDVENPLLKSFKKLPLPIEKLQNREPKEEKLEAFNRKKEIPPVVNNLLKKDESVNKKSEASAAVSKPAQPLAPPQIKIAVPEKEEKTKLEKKPDVVVGNYEMPSLDLLEDAPVIPASKLQEDLQGGAKILEETLADFGVSVRVDNIERGPVITRYELEPAPGVKVGKITTLADDIALAMRAQTVRIVAPIPGKNRVGIEIPNGASSSVFLKDVLAEGQFRNAGSKLMLALGKDIAGKPLIADLADMPHLLIAGTTGAGKSVCVNGIIMSMLYNATPDEVKFLMVDPKMVELTQYNDLPHVLCPAVTDAKKVSAALNWVVGEMESRYGLLRDAGVKNIKGYHEKGNKLPYIVVIIDELADLMQVSAKTVESSITRLAQLSRAVGIHLILATQRPSVDVITGVIKANFPARISFKVASKVDSRTVLDMNGAENLLGKGDMLFMKPGDPKPTRGQCAFVSDKELSRVIDYIKKQQQPTYDDSILAPQPSAGAGPTGEKDELYDEAVRLVMETNQASVSILQRRMRLGYTRAARLIDLMEQDGLVGPYVGSKPRDIMVNREEWLIQNMNINNNSKKDGTA